MSNAFAEMKKQRKSMYDKLVEETNKLQNTNTSDDRFWQPEVDKAGNGSAIIRFLPAPNGETLPWVRLFSHGFQGPGGWYIENSLTTLGQEDPVGEYNSRLWNRGDEAGKQQARAQKRRLSYISNIYIVKDPARPEREGQVYLYKYGKKIFDKINDLMHPEFDDEEPINPFDFWEGANFRLKIRDVEGYRNYDKSEFDKPSALFDDDAELEALWAKEYSLEEFLDPKNFKSYAELKARLTRVLGMNTSAEDTEEEDEDMSWTEETSESKSNEPKREKSVTVEDDEDEDLNFFKELAKET